MKKNYTAIIVDDEFYARELVKQFLQKHNEIQIIGEYDNGFDALKGIKEKMPDIVFLDVQMPKLTGLELLDLLEFFPQIIFTTAYDEYAVKAFELNAVDYLLKPFSEERFNEAVKKAVFHIENDKTSEMKEKLLKLKTQTDRIAVHKGKHIVIVPFNDILYISAADDYIELHTQNDKYLKKMTMDNIAEKLPENFIRIHRSTILNLNFLKQIEKIGKENYFAVTTNGIPLKISRSNYPAVKQKLNL